MRISQDQIKAAFLHPEAEVRRVAVGYFVDGFSRDPSVMPLIIQAVEKYGRKTAFTMLRIAEGFAQTPATVEWMMQELARPYDVEDVDQDNYRCAISLLLCNADSHLLVPVTDQIIAMPAFPRQLQRELRLQAERAEWDWPTGWNALQEWGRMTQPGQAWRSGDERQEQLIIRELGRFRAAGAPTVLQLLERRFRGYDKKLMLWLEPQLVQLAGEMQLAAAIPQLVYRLHENDFEVDDFLGAALAKIGTEEVIHALAKDWPEGSEGFHFTAVETLEGIRSDLSLRTVLHFLEGQENAETAYALSRAALAQFDDDAIEPVRRFLLQDGEDDDYTGFHSELRWRLVAAATIMGASFPEYPAWYAEAVEKHWGFGTDSEFRYSDSFGSDEDDRGLQDEEDVSTDETDFRQEPAPQVETIIRHEEKTGRNDPCPCGSGKKYKKCCMNKG